MRFLAILFLVAACSSNKSAKQEFNETADQVDAGTRRIIKEAKDTGTKLLKKMDEE